MPLRVTKAEARAYQTTLDGTTVEVTERKKPVREEAMHQAALMRHRKQMEPIYPNLQFLFSTLNGIFLPPKLRAQAVEAGMAPGILDMFYMLRREGAPGDSYVGLAMELKKLKDGRPSADQLTWAQHLVANGWLVCFPAGCVEAWRILCGFEGISGADHLSEELIREEKTIRRVCSVEHPSLFYPHD